MKPAKEHWDNIVTTLRSTYAGVSDDEWRRIVATAEISFVSMYTMLQHEFSIEEPEKFAAFIKGIVQIVRESNEKTNSDDTGRR